MPPPQPAARHPCGRRRRLLSLSPPQSPLPPTAVCRVCEAVCVATPVPPSNKLQKVILSIIIYRFEFFLRVEFACNYHAIWAKSKLCNEIWAPSERNSVLG